MCSSKANTPVMKTRNGSDRRQEEGGEAGFSRGLMHAIHIVRKLKPLCLHPDIPTHYIAAFTTLRLVPGTVLYQYICASDMQQD